MILIFPGLHWCPVRTSSPPPCQEKPFPSRCSRSRQPPNTPTRENCPRPSSPNHLIERVSGSGYCAVLRWRSSAFWHDRTYCTALVRKHYHVVENKQTEFLTCCGTGRPFPEVETSGGFSFISKDQATGTRDWIAIDNFCKKASFRRSGSKKNPDRIAPFPLVWHDPIDQGPIKNQRTSGQNIKRQRHDVRPPFPFSCLDMTQLITRIARNWLLRFLNTSLQWNWSR